MTRKKSADNFDYTASKRNSKARNRAAGTAPAVLLDQQHSDAFGEILAHSGETAAAWVRRMIRQEAPNDFWQP